MMRKNPCDEVKNYEQKQRTYIFIVEACAIKDENAGTGPI